MPEYQLQIKQVVDYPRCRIYREFIHKLINDRSIRINGGSGRWGLSRATVCRILKKLDGLGYISIMSFPGRHGSVIYLQNYLSTMFEISDVLIDKEEVAMTLNIHLELPETAETEESHSISEHEVIVSDALSSISKSHIETILRKMADILSTQGISCFSCPLSRYQLYPLSDDCWEELIPRARGKSFLIG